MHKRKKGQTPIIETVLLFGVSITIFVILATVFISYQGFFLSANAVDQLEEVNMFVTAHILQLAVKEGVDSLVTIEIPKAIANEQYEIRAVSNGINITTHTTRKTTFTPLFNLTEKINISGDRILSRRGRVIINKQGNRIILS